MAHPAVRSLPHLDRGVGARVGDVHLGHVLLGPRHAGCTRAKHNMRRYEARWVRAGGPAQGSGRGAMAKQGAQGRERGRGRTEAVRRGVAVGVRDTVTEPAVLEPQAHL